MSVIFLVAFVLDLIFGNGVGNWYDWLFGALLINSGGNLLSTFEKYHGTREIYKFNSGFVSDVLNGIVIALLIVRLVFGTIFNWWDCLIGAGFAFAVRNLLTTFVTRR